MSLLVELWRVCQLLQDPDSSPVKWGYCRWSLRCLPALTCPTALFFHSFLDVYDCPWGGKAVSPDQLTTRRTWTVSVINEAKKYSSGLDLDDGFWETGSGMRNVICIKNEGESCRGSCKVGVDRETIYLRLPLLAWSSIPIYLNLHFTDIKSK